MFGSYQKNLPITFQNNLMCMNQIKAKARFVMQYRIKLTSFKIFLLKRWRGTVPVQLSWSRVNLKASAIKHEPIPSQHRAQHLNCKATASFPLLGQGMGMNIVYNSTISLSHSLHLPSLYNKLVSSDHFGSIVQRSGVTLSMVVHAVPY